MKLFWATTTVVAACMLASCQRGSPPTSSVVATMPGPTAAPSKPDAPVAQRLRGLMVMGKDGYGLTACGEATQKMVTFMPDPQKVIDSFVSGGAREFFIDAWATPDADDHWSIQRVERAQAEGQGCEEALTAVTFKAHGNEPFWALTITGNQLRLERPDVAVVVALFDSVGQQGDTRRLHANTVSGAVDVTLGAQPCRDSMADAVFAWTAQVMIDGKLLQGCAYQGDQ